MNVRTTHKRRPDHGRRGVRMATNFAAVGARAPVLERAAALAGLLAFVTFNLGWIAGDFAQRPAFSSTHDDVSHLGAMTASSPWLENQVSANLSGLLIVALGVGLWLALSPSRLGRLGAATLAAMGVGLFLDGFLRLDCQPIDAGCSNDSWHSHAHKINSALLGGFSFVSILLLALAFRRLPRWRDSWLPLLATIPASFIAGLAFSSLGSGAAQRAANGVAMAAVAFIAFRLLQHASEAHKKVAQ
jgi:hypothetical protein